MKFMIFLTLVLHVIGSLANYQNRNFPILRTSVVEDGEHVLPKRHAPHYGPVKTGHAPVHWTPVHLHDLPTVHHEPVHQHKEEPVVHHEPVKVHEPVHHEKVPVHYYKRESLGHHESVKHHKVPVAHEPVHYLKPVHHEPVHHEKVYHKEESVVHHKEVPVHHKEVPVHHEPVHFHKEVVHHKAPVVHHEPVKVHKTYHHVPKEVHHESKGYHHHEPTKHEPVKYGKSHGPSHKRGSYGHHRVHKRGAGYWNEGYSSYPSYKSFDSHPSYTWDKPTYSDWDHTSYDHGDYDSGYPSYYDKHDTDDYYSHYPHHTHHSGCPWKKPHTTTTTPKPVVVEKPVKVKKPVKQNVEAVIQAVGNALLDVQDQLLNPGNPRRPANQVRPVVVVNPDNPDVGEEGLFVPLVRPVDLSRSENETRSNDEEDEDELPVIEDPVNLDPDFVPSDLRLDSVNTTNQTPKEEVKQEQDETSNTEKNSRSMTLEDFGIDVRSAVNPRR